MSGQRGSSSMPCGGLCHVLWGLCYVAAGAVQLVAGLFALKWLPVLGLGTNIVSGSWNLLAGITCALIAGLATELNAGRLNALLCISISVLAVDAVNLAILELYEWPFLVTKADQDIIKQRSMEKLVCYARLSTSVSSFLIVIIALLDTHISFCVLHNRKTSKRRAETNNAAPDPILNDMEYILPRRPTNLDDDDDEEQHHLTSNPNSAQAWVFDTGPIGGCATEVKTRLSTDEPLSACNRPNTYLLSRTPQQSNKVVVKLEVPAYEDRTSLNFMRSFSRTPSPTCSLSHPIYESVDKRTATVSPRARLYTADYAYAKHHRPGSSTDTARTHRRSESCDTRPHSVSSFHPPTVASSTAATPSGKYQYASLMMELEQAIQNKKDDDEEGSPVGSGSTDPSTLKDNSDTEFSKELEAALQMLQDLGSPNTIETPSEPSRSITTMPPPAVEMKKLAVVHEGRSSRASSSGYSSPTLTGSLSHLFPPPPPPLPGAVGSSSCSIQRRDDNSTVITVNSSDSAESKAVSTVDLNPDPVSDFFKIGTWGTGTNNSRTSSGIGHDLENALLQTESLACLSELELLARHCRQKAEQRQIERKVQRQMSIRASSMRDALKKTLPSYSVDGYQVKDSPA
ncbi:uncharacterized protein LOC135939288 [Cloeon dipterum]|uniref:uncharacterized protein LOC135939288 n=1 Tax=Cloeon dipterum TaxID=197152 RepID=UPI0032205DD0